MWYIQEMAMTGPGSSQQFGRLRWEDHLGPGVQDQPGQYSETPSLQKILKSSQAWLCAPVVPASQEAEQENLSFFWL